MKKITYLVLHLGFGGVEKAVANQANIFCENYEVEIISAYKLYDTPPFYINPKVKITYLMEDLKPNPKEFKAALRSKNPFKIIKEGMISVKVLHNRTALMKKAIKDCNSDLIVSTRVLYNKLLSDNCKKTAVTIAQEHNHHNNNEKYINEVCNSAKNIDWLMPVSQELTDFYAERLKDEHVKCKFIPHCLDFWPQEVSTLKSKNIVTVGRLCVEKNYLELVDIFEIFSKTHPDWTLSIIGDGYQKNEIENKIKQKNLQDKITMHGFLKKPQVNEILQNSSIYAMTSITESFAIVLMEAQSFGLPCVTFDSARGAFEVLNRESGFFVKAGDDEAYAAKLILLADNTEIRGKLGQAGRKNAEQFKEENIALKLNNFLKEILK